MNDLSDILEDELILSDADSAASDEKNTKDIVSGSDSESSGQELKRTIISDTDDENTEVFEEKHERRKLILNNAPDLPFVIAALCAAAVIVSGSFIAGMNIRRDPAAVEASYASQRQKNTEYNDLLVNTASVQEQNDSLYQERDRIKSEAEALQEYASKSEEIDQQIIDMQTELEHLTSDNEIKKAEINKITGSITKKTASIINLPPGMYTVGKEIVAGTYSITGSGKLLVSNSAGAVKFNDVLTADAKEIILDDGDKLKLDTKAKFVLSSAAAQTSEPQEADTQ